MQLNTNLTLSQKMSKAIQAIISNLSTLFDNILYNSVIMKRSNMIKISSK